MVGERDMDERKEKEQEQERLKRQHEECLKKCSKVLVKQTNPEEYLGNFDALKEWENKTEAYEKFLNTEAYKTFIKDDYLCLIGRTGTGKTAILNRYQYEIEKNRNGNLKFKNVIRIDLKQYISTLMRYGQIDNTTVSFQEVQNNISTMINILAMRKVLELAETNDFIYNSSEPIRKYMKAKKLSKDLDFVEKLTQDFQNIYDGQKSARLAGTIGILSAIAKQYNSPDYSAAIKSMHTCFENRPLLVLVDSLDIYDTRESELIVIIKGLIEVAFEYYNKFKKRNILVKVAIPSEIISDVTAALPEKHQSNTVAIEWKYKDLVKMIAIRFLFYCKSEAANDIFKEYANKFELDDFYDDYNKAKTFLLEFLPKKCRAVVSLEFDTIAYLVRHTQKKPRQLMRIFNGLIDEMIKQKNTKLFCEYEGQISRCIHQTQPEMIKDAINMFTVSTNTEIRNICETIFLGKKYLFTKNYIIEEIKRYNRDRLKNKSELKHLDEEDFFEMIVASGLIGKPQSYRFVDKGNSWFCNKDNVVKIVVTLFEYQIKDKLRFEKEDICILHPMCYEWYENEIDLNTLVYPIPIDDSEDFEEGDATMFKELIGIE